MASLTVFGDSLVRRQGGFIDRVPFGVPVHFIGKGGMRALAVPDDLWQELLRTRPTHVFLHFGGNDISSDSSPRVIFEEIKCRVEELISFGVQCVWVGEVLPRGRFNRSPGLWAAEYERQRRALNRLLHNFMKHRFILFRFHVFTLTGIPHRDFLSDLVHLSVFGQRKYHRVLLRLLRRELS